MKTGPLTIHLQRPKQYRKLKGYKQKIFSKDEFSFTVLNTHAAFETWIAKEILCLRNAPVMGMLFHQRDFCTDIQDKIRQRTRQLRAPH